MPQNKTIARLLAGESDNHILPFFWQHGEDEATLRKMMAAIDGAHCRAVCVESRPHPPNKGECWEGRGGEGRGGGGGEGGGKVFLGGGGGWI